MSKLLNQLTSPESVLAAIRECDESGREEFLRRYGYKHSRNYLLHHNGQVYDSKAIAGVAYGKQHGVALKASEFSGGEATVIPCLRRLGFVAGKNEHPATQLVRGKTYFRKDLIALFGGQLQAGIWTPKEFNAVFIFSGESGKLYGYYDGWTQSGVFRYTGEGQLDDMTFTNGNRAIRDHRQDGKDLLLFEDLGKGKGVRYEGLFDFASWDEVEALDKDKKLRKTIVFNLVPVNTAASVSADDLVAQPDLVPLSLDQLRVLAYAAGASGASPENSGDAKKSWYKRSETVKRYVLARAAGTCEACLLPAPFTKKDGSPYLEPHHTKRLSDEGPDHPAWVGAICPNCHRRIHSGADGAAWNEELQGRLRELER
ncbi:MAG TPA: HNH endonuclease signature motif containing protein [Pseudomonas sp.]|nr:HNH endonuclease signature motif containing protein [Pseudomonas sp.]